MSLLRRHSAGPILANQRARLPVGIRYQVALHSHTDGAVESAFEIEAASDKDAIDSIRAALDHPGEINVWDGERLVGRFTRRLI